jgi:hypothetical protein
MNNEIKEVEKEKQQTKTFYIDDATWLKFRHRCLDEGESATSKINEFIRNYLNS